MRRSEIDRVRVESEALGLGAGTGPEIFKDPHPGGRAIGFLLGGGSVAQRSMRFVAQAGSFIEACIGQGLSFACVVSGDDLAEGTDDLKKGRLQHVVVAQRVAQAGFHVACAFEIKFELQDSDCVAAVVLICWQGTGRWQLRGL
jgi:hypothetical protein